MREKIPATSTRIQIDRLSLPLAGLSSAGQEQQALRERAAAALKVAPQRIGELRILKKSLDARRKSAVQFVYSVAVQLSGPLPPRARLYQEAQPLSLPQLQLHGERPCVVGAGPAGLFAALLLARAGLCPLLIEQGQDVAQRRSDVDAFWAGGPLLPLSNIQFGEGGAGAFSDGKLTSRSKDPLGREVLRLLIEAGADPAIAYWHKPHLGSDRLPLLIAELRRQIQLLGGEVRFNTRLVGLISSGGRLLGLRLRSDESEYELACRQLVLAAGNGARQLYRLLSGQGVALQAKPFAVGMRIQQPQRLINQAQYGPFMQHPLLGAADYNLTYQDEKQQRGCYSFCNCPGGFIVNASSEPDGLVTNGVSLAARDGDFCNAAVVGQVSPGRDFGTDELDGLLYQEGLEQAAYALSASHALPLMPAQSFIDGCARPLGDFPGRAAICSAAVCEADLRALFDARLCASLQQALAHWEQQLPGFSSQAVVVAVETRTSAPLRILRDQTRQSLNLSGLYPAGEGAGYAGGIVSSAIDGMRSALAIIESYC